jgi:hypothetical protein
MRHLLALVALVALPATVRAQSASIAPGMSRAQVVAAFGEPVTARTASEFTYMFYRNDCGKACGMNDLVILRSDSVVDAVLRSPSRRYTGTSSSPTALSRGEARNPDAQRVAEPVQIPVRKAEATAPAPVAATTAAPRQASPATVEKLRRELLGSGLTGTQIRARLRAEGYSEHLLDSYMTSAAQASASTMKPGTPKDTKPSITTTPTKPPTP